MSRRKHEPITVRPQRSFRVIVQGTCGFVPRFGCTENSKSTKTPIGFITNVWYIWVSTQKIWENPQIIHLFIGFPIINHPFWGTPIFGNTHLYLYNLPQKSTIHVGVHIPVPWILWTISCMFFSFGWGGYEESFWVNWNPFECLIWAWVRPMGVRSFQKLEVIRRPLRLHIPWVWPPSQDAGSWQMKLYVLGSPILNM